MATDILWMGRSCTVSEIKVGWPNNTTMLQYIIEDKDIMVGI